jgi:hypothetical protein
VLEGKDGDQVSGLAAIQCLFVWSYHPITTALKNGQSRDNGYIPPSLPLKRPLFSGADNASKRAAPYDSVITKYSTSEVLCQLAYEKLECIAKLWGTIK